jgi:predicted RNA-binding protein Jag
MSENQITTEGINIDEAVAKAAEQLGIPADQVGHKLDFSHFRNEQGRSIPVETVKIIAWATDPSDKEGALAAKAWIEGLISKMGFEGTVTTQNIRDNKATIAVNSESARFLVGRGGSTLHAISDMLNVAMKDEFSDWSFDIDVQGGQREERRDGGDRDRGDRDRGDRDRGDRGGRDRDRGGRDRGGRDRDRDRGGRGDDRERCSDDDVRDLKRLARRVAEAVVEGGEAEVIRKPLNSFERRIVHMEIADMDGVNTDTVEQDGERKIRIFVDNGEAASAEA